MKKLSLVIAAALCLTLASCGGNKTETPATPTGTDTTAVKEECQKQDKCCSGMTEEQKKECEEFKAKWDNWANLTDVEKKELIAKKKECFDKKKAQMEEMEAQMKAKKAEMNAEFAKWDKLSLDEQKALLDKVGSCCKSKMGCGDKADCSNKKEGCDQKKEGCGKHDGHKH